MYNQKPIKQYRFLSLISLIFMTIFIVCETTAFRMVDFLGQSVPASGLIIPIIFSLGDIVAEVYGYAIVRKLIWNSLFCQLMFGFLMNIVIILPSKQMDLSHNIHYTLAFEHITRTNVISFLSVTSGMFTNAFLISKLKIYMQGKKYWFRTILSSGISEFVLCFVAYNTLFLGLKPYSEIISIVFYVWIYKIVFAIVVANFVALIAKKLKKIEQSDVYDVNTKFSPFIY